MTFYRTLLAYFIVFTLLDVLATAAGLTVGCVELNPFVTGLGVGVWAVFRVVLLAYLLAVFIIGYRFCVSRFSHQIWLTRVFEAVLFALDLYIGAVVFSGFFAIYATLTL